MTKKSITETWILNPVIVTQDDKRRVFRGHIHIVNGRIESISLKRPSRISPHATTIEADDLIVLPGFVQAHVHLCQTLFRNQADDLELLDWLDKRIWKFEAAHTPKTLHASALLGIHELLSTGTTCILDMATVRHTEAIYDAVKTTGIRANVGKCLMDHPKMTPENLRESTLSALSEASHLYKLWHGRENDRIRVSYAPRFVISCTEDLLKHVVSLSNEQGTLIHTHASENLKEIQIVKSLVNCENIEYLQQLGMTSKKLVLAHCIWLKQGEMNILKNSGTHVVHCPSSNLKLASGIAHIPEMLERGINVALGADGAPCNNNLNQLQEMRMAALIHKVGNGPRSMQAQTVLDMATRNGAKALDWFDQIGSIEVGKKADLIAFDLTGPENSGAYYPSELSGHLNPEAIVSGIVYSTQPHHLHWSMVDGKMVFKNGRMTSLNRESLMQQVYEAQIELLKLSTKMVNPFRAP